MPSTPPPAAASLDEIVRANATDQVAALFAPHPSPGAVAEAIVKADQLGHLTLRDALLQHPFDASQACLLALRKNQKDVVRLVLSSASTKIVKQVLPVLIAQGDDVAFADLLLHHAKVRSMSLSGIFYDVLNTTWPQHLYDLSHRYDQTDPSRSSAQQTAIKNTKEWISWTVTQSSKIQECCDPVSLLTPLVSQACRLPTTDLLQHLLLEYKRARQLRDAYQAQSSQAPVEVSVLEEHDARLWGNTLLHAVACDLSAPRTNNYQPAPNQAVLQTYITTMSSSWPELAELCVRRHPGEPMATLNDPSAHRRITPNDHDDSDWGTLFETVVLPQLSPQETADLLKLTQILGRSIPAVVNQAITLALPISPNRPAVKAKRL